jgi:hypothetical protein
MATGRTSVVASDYSMAKWAELTAALLPQRAVIIFVRPA